MAGTVFDRDRARFAEVNRLAIDIAPEGHLLMLFNEDAPGVVGQVGTLLAERGVNIADMSLGRDRDGGTAIVALVLDEPVNATDLAAIAALPNMRWARLVTM